MNIFNKKRTCKAFSGRGEAVWLPPPRELNKWLSVAWPQGGSCGAVVPEVEQVSFKCSICYCVSCRNSDCEMQSKSGEGSLNLHLNSNIWNQIKWPVSSSASKKADVLRSNLKITELYQYCFFSVY